MLWVGDIDPSYGDSFLINDEVSADCKNYVTRMALRNFVSCLENPGVAPQQKRHGVKDGKGG